MRALLLLGAGLGTVACWETDAGAEAFRKGPYLQGVTTEAVTVIWESHGAAAGRVTVRSVGEAERVLAVPPALLHEVRIEGLTPGRRYAYTVESGGEAAGGELTTAPAESEPFAFAVFGDTRSNPDAHRAVVERIRCEVPDFILGTGDMVYDGALDDDWQEFFTIERELLRDNVLFPTLGNHDRQGRARTVENFRRYFALPDDSPQPERYYAFTYGNSRFLVLDSNEHSFALTDQTEWLTRELSRSVADASVRHRFVVMHHPPFSTSLHGGQRELREIWAPLFERYGVDAVFSGHDHVYERSDHGGVRYFVTGGGGAPLYPRDPNPAPEDVQASVYFERTYHYLRLHVVGDFVEVAAIRDDGTLIESLSWGTMPAVARAPRQEPPKHLAATSAPAPSCGCGIGTLSIFLALRRCAGLWRRRADPLAPVRPGKYAHTSHHVDRSRSSCQ